MKLECKICGKEFEFSEGEMKFYAGKGFTWPRKCKSCRDSYMGVNLGLRPNSFGKNAQLYGMPVPVEGGTPDIEHVYTAAKKDGRDNTVYFKITSAERDGDRVLIKKYDWTSDFNQAFFFRTKKVAQRLLTDIVTATNEDSTNYKIVAKGVWA